MSRIPTAPSRRTCSRRWSRAIQAVEPLKIGELWALPSLLRFVLIENLRRIAVRVEPRARRCARSPTRSPTACWRPTTSDDRRQILSHYAAHARDTTFATQLLYRLRDGSQNAGKALNWLEKELEKSGSDAEEIIIAEHHTLSSGNVTTGNIIRGLRLINDIDWTVLVRRTSAASTRCCASAPISPRSISPRATSTAARSRNWRAAPNRREFEVAEKATELAGYVPRRRRRRRRAMRGRRTATDVGFFLVGPRRQELEKAIGYRPAFGRTAQARLPRHRLAGHRRAGLPADRAADGR